MSITRTRQTTVPRASGETPQGKRLTQLFRWTFPILAVASTAWASQDLGEHERLLKVSLMVTAAAFAVTAAILLGDDHQRGNGIVFGLVTVTFVLDRSTWLPIGRWAIVGAFAGTFTPVLIAVILLRYPEPSLDRGAGVFIRINFAIASLLGVATAITYPDWTGGAWNPSHQFQWVISVRRLWEGVGAAGCLIFIVRRYVRAGQIERSILQPVLLAGAVEVSLIGTTALQPWTPPPIAPTLTYARTWGAAVVALSLFLSTLVLLQSLAGVARLVAEMKGADTVDSVQHGLRRALRHPQLKVYYWMPDRSQFVGPGGVVTRSLDSYLDPQVIRVCTDDGDLLGAVLVEDEPVINDQLRKSIQGVCRLAMSNTRLEAELRLQLKENADARARIVTSSLQERRRLERDMHDGAQQRLLGVGMLLSVAEQAASGDLQLLVQRIQAELDQALGELRDLAHGIYPELLERYGLKAALEHVIIRLPLNIDTYVDDRRWPPEVEGAVYFSTCEALSNTCKHAGATTAWLSIHDENGSVDVKIGDNGRGSPSLNERGALPNIRDRVDSMAGTLMVRSGPGGTHIHLRIPNPAPLHH